MTQREENPTLPHRSASLCKATCLTFPSKQTLGVCLQLRTLVCIFHRKPVQKRIQDFKGGFEHKLLVPELSFRPHNLCVVRERGHQPTGLCLQFYGPEDFFFWKSKLPFALLVVGGGALRLTFN